MLDFILVMQGIDTPISCYCLTSSGMKKDSQSLPDTYFVIMAASSHAERAHVTIPLLNIFLFVSPCAVQSFMASDIYSVLYAQGFLSGPAIHHHSNFRSIKLTERLPQEYII